MAPVTRSIAGTSNNEDGGVNETLRSLEESLEIVTRVMQEMVTMNQGGNGNRRNQNQNQFTRMTKVEFLKFLRDDVKGWIFRCKQFFSIDEILKNQKRFSTVYDDPISEIRKVKYQTNAKEYQDAFDTLFSRVDISEEHVVSFYLGGLPAEIEIGKISKGAITPYGSKFGGGIGQSSSFKPSLLGLPASNLNWKPKPNTPLIAPVRKQLTQKEYQEKRAQNLCFYYNQKYTLWHKCSGHLYLLIVVLEEEEVEFFKVEEGMEDTVMQNEIPQISLNALNVTVGGDGQLVSASECKDFVWKLQGVTFVTDIMILPLGGCEMKNGFERAPKTTLQWMDVKHQEKQVVGVPHAELLMLSVFPNTGLQLMNLITGSQKVHKDLQKEPMEDQPLPADASPTALSLGYVVDFDPEKDEKDPKEDTAYYSADRGDNDDNKSSNDDDDDDVEKDEEEKEEEEHLAPADPSDVSTDDLVPSS
nr:hypothetical protein [Tanacetum cinerariifolium]